MNIKYFPALNISLSVIVIVVMILGFAFTCRHYQKQVSDLHWMQEAVDKGVGEWVIEYQETDFSDVKRSFRWKLPRK